MRMDRVMTVWSAMEEQKSLTCVFVGCGVVLDVRLYKEEKFIH